VTLVADYRMQKRTSCSRIPLSQGTSDAAPTQSDVMRGPVRLSHTAGQGQLGRRSDVSERPDLPMSGRRGIVCLYIQVNAIDASGDYYPASSPGMRACADSEWLAPVSTVGSASRGSPGYVPVSFMPMSWFALLRSLSLQWAVPGPLGVVMVRRWRGLRRVRPPSARRASRPC